MASESEAPGDGGASIGGVGSSAASDTAGPSGPSARLATDGAEAPAHGPSLRKLRYGKEFIGDFEPLHLGEGHTQQVGVELGP
jgi:hypothetical protein